MAAIFQSTWWQIALSAPWKARECEECVAITQPEGIGALHISSARKLDGSVLDTEALSQLGENCPEGTETQKARYGDFIGYAAEYVDWNEGAYWKKWFLGRRKILLFATYTARAARRTWRAPRSRRCFRPSAVENETAGSLASYEHAFRKNCAA